MPRSSAQKPYWIERRNRKRERRSERVREKKKKNRRERMCLEESKREEKERTCKEKSWKESREASRYHVHELFMGGEVKKDDLEEKDLITCSRTILLALTGLY